MLDRGELGHVRVGQRRVRIRRSQLDAFLAAGESSPQSAGADPWRPVSEAIGGVAAAVKGQIAMLSIAQSPALWKPLTGFPRSRHFAWLRQPERVHSASTRSTSGVFRPPQPYTPLCGFPWILFPIVGGRERSRPVEPSVVRKGSSGRVRRRALANCLHIGGFCRLDPSIRVYSRIAYKQA
jgi:hypothetical protein